MLLRSERPAWVEVCLSSEIEAERSENSTGLSMPGQQHNAVNTECELFTKCHAAGARWRERFLDVRLPWDEAACKNTPLPVKV